MILIEKLTAKYRESGFKGLSLSLVAKIPAVRSVCVYYIFTLPCGAPALKNLSMENINILRADESSIADLIHINDKRDIFLERFRKGYTCFIAYSEGKPVAYMWGQTGEVHVEEQFGFEIPIDQNQFYCFDAHTLPEYRKSGIAKLLLRKIMEYFETQYNKKELVDFVEVTNTVSLKVHEKLGFHKKALLFFINFAGRKINKIIYSYANN